MTKSTSADAHKLRRPCDSHSEQERAPDEILASYFSRLRESVKIEFLRAVDENLMRAAGYAPTAEIAGERPNSAPARTEADAPDARPRASARLEHRRAVRMPKNDHVLVVVNDGEVVFEGVMIDYSRHGARISLNASVNVPERVKLVESANGRTHIARKVWAEAGEIGIDFIS